jgi:hypothetical protein
MLDHYMEAHQDADDEFIDGLRNRFKARVGLAKSVFGKSAFRIPAPKEDAEKLSIPLWDAVMVALDRQYAQRDDLIANRTRIVARLNKKLESDRKFVDLIVGKPNTADAVKERIAAVEHLMISA